MGIASTTPAGRLHVTTSGDNSGNAGGMGNWDSSYAVIANGGGANNAGFGIGIYSPDYRINLLALQPGIAWMNLFYNANSHNWTYQGYLAMKFAYNSSAGLVALGLNYNSAYYPFEIGATVGGVSINANGAAYFNDHRLPIERKAEA